MTALDIGLGAHQVLSRPGIGMVASVHRKAVYLRFPSGLCALVDGSTASGPLHLRRDPLPACRPGDPVRTDGRVLSGPAFALSVRPRHWVGRLPNGLRGTLDPAEVQRWAERIGGRGPGLTPAGDDVLAGMLLSSAAAHAGNKRAEARLRQVADQVATTEIAWAFLSWAARGQCIAPAHDALAELVRHGRDASGPACATLADVGASSGRALLLGLRAGLGSDATEQISTMMKLHLS
jgi:uncharacterized protein DUF2877